MSMICGEYWVFHSNFQFKLLLTKIFIVATKKIQKIKHEHADRIKGQYSSFLKTSEGKGSGENVDRDRTIRSHVVLHNAGPTLNWPRYLGPIGGVSSLTKKARWLKHEGGISMTLLPT